MKLGELLTYYRKEKKWTQTHLAKCVALKQPQIAAYETERRKPPLNYLMQIIEALRLSKQEADELLITAGYPVSTQLDLTNDAVRELHAALWDQDFSQERKDLLTKAVITVVQACREIVKEKTVNHQRHNSDLLQTARIQREAVEAIFQRLVGHLTVIEVGASLHQNQLESAANLLKSSVIRNAKYNAESGEIWATSTLLEGDVLMEQGWWDKAIVKYEEAYDIFFHNHHTDRTGQAQAKRKLATIYILKGEFTRAEDYLNAAIGMLEVSNTYERAKTYYDLGLLYSITGKLDTAHDYIRKELELAISLDNPYLRMLGYSGLGHIYRQTYQWPLAREAFAKAQSLAVLIEDRRALGWVLLGLGRVEYFTGAHAWVNGETEQAKDEARQYYRKAYEYFNTASKLLYENHHRYRYELARLLIGKVIIVDHDCQCLPADADIYDDHHDNGYKLEGLAKVRALYDLALNGFEEMGCNYYLGKTLQYLCGLARKVADSSTGNRDTCLKRADEEIEKYIERLRQLDDRHEQAGYDHKYPQHMARARTDHALIAVKQGQLKLAVERYCSAFCYANSFNLYVTKEIEDRLDYALRLVQQIQTLVPHEAKYLEVPGRTESRMIASQFCLKLATLLESKKNDLAVNSSGEKLQRLGLLIKGMSEKAKAIQMYRSLPKIISIPKHMPLES